MRRISLISICFSFLAMALSCASGGGPPIDLSKLPPIVIGVPAPPTAPEQKPDLPQKLMATVAFHVFDADTKEPIRDAIGTFEDDTTIQVNDDGYMSIVKEFNTYEVKITATDYAPTKRDVVLSGNRQFEVPMKSTKPAPPPVIVPPVIVAPPPVVVPPVVVPPVAISPLEEAAGWSDEQWRAYLMPLLKRNGELVNDLSMKLARPDVIARGADFQNGWRGDVRPRIFLPVPGCPPATRADVPECSYNRTFDFGQYGQPWEWIKR